METLAPEHRTLGPNQIRWLRAQIPAFDLAWRSVQKADAHKAKVYSDMGVEPGALRSHCKNGKRAANA